MKAKSCSLGGIVLICFGVVLRLDIAAGDVHRLDENTFQQFITDNELVLALFTSSGECPTCNKALQYLDKTPQPELVQTEIQKVTLTDEKIATKYGVTQFPTVVYFRQQYAAIYHRQLASTDDMPEFVDWVTTAVTVATKDLVDDSFEHLTQASTGATTGDWFVIFYESSCSCCMKALPAIESAAIRTKQRMNFAKVDIDVNTGLVERFKLNKFPSAILFKQGKMYAYEPEKYESQALVSFVESWYKNVKASPVPTIPTAFDKLTESIALYIKEQVNNPDRKLTFVAMAIGACLLIVAVVIFVFRKPTENRFKFD